MAKGQQRNNREHKKPKQAKKAVPSSFVATPAKAAAVAPAPGKKK